MVLLSEGIRDKGGKIIGIVHDDIILEGFADHADEFAEILRATIIEAGSVYFKEIPIDVEVEAKIANGWAEK